ncbi:MAG: glycosyltransferase family 4 protein [Anaerolineales bacterium]
MDVLIIYQFCTFGGVERAVLNRVQSLKQSGLNLHVSMGYLNDSGALASFQNYIQTHGLSDQLSAFVFSSTSNFDWHKYQLILVIDTPQILDLLQKNNNVFVECHTTYHHNQQYLASLPQNIRGLLVPSVSLKNELLKKFHNLPPIHIIPNPVPDVFYQDAPAPHGMIFAKRPLVYFARVDSLKNFDEALNIYLSSSQNHELMYMVIGRGAGDPKLVSALKKKNLLERTLLRDQIPFDQAPYLTQLVRRHRGIFLSPSKGESFGLSAAEFMAARVPVLLSDIPAHRELVENDERFLYQLGNVNMATKKLSHLLHNWDEMSRAIASYAHKFRGEAFLSAWMAFLADLETTDIIQKSNSR